MSIQSAQRVFRSIPFLTLIAVLWGLSPAVRTQDARDRIDPSLMRNTGGVRGGITVFGTGQYLTDPSAANPEAIALNYVRAHAEDFGLSERDAQKDLIEWIVLRDGN